MFSLRSTEPWVIGSTVPARARWACLAAASLALVASASALAARAQPVAPPTPAALSSEPLSPEPLSPEQRRLVAAVPSEDTPLPEEHYLVSNEWRHDLYFDSIRDLGGAFVGVGTDQCYTLATVQRASLVWIVDYDPLVPRVHRMYEVLVGASETPADLLARFEPDAASETVALLERRLGDAPGARRVVQAYRGNRRQFEVHLRRVAQLRRDGRPTSWLSNPTLYARLRALFAAGRVIARSADVTGPTTMRAVGAASRELGALVRVVYFSNAEQFFRYDDGFQQNVRSLPTDERSVVLRTFRHRRRVQYPEGDSWAFMVHPMPDFLERLSLGYRRNTHIVMDAVRGGPGVQGVTTIGPSTPRDYVP